MDKIKFIFKKFGVFCHVILTTEMQNKALTLNIFYCLCRRRVIQVLTSNLLILFSLKNVHEAEWIQILSDTGNPLWSNRITVWCTSFCFVISRRQSITISRCVSTTFMAVSKHLLQQCVHWSQWLPYPQYHANLFTVTTNILLLRDKQRYHTNSYS